MSSMTPLSIGSSGSMARNSSWSIYAEQIRRWRAEGPSAAQRRELGRLEEQNRRLRQVTTDVLALARELRNGASNRIMAMSDLELGLQAILGTLPSRRP